MRGQLVQRSEGSWSIVLYLGKDPVSGKKKFKWHTFRGNKKGAEKELNRLVREVNTGEYVDAGNLTVKDYLERWLSDYAKVNVAAKTFERYAGIVRHHLIPALGALPLANLRPLHIQACYSAALAEKGRKDGRGGGLSKQTVLHHHRVLRQALKQAVRWQLVARNVADAVEPPRPVFHEVNALDEARTAALLDAAEGTSLRIPILLAITTGMRRGEILAIRWQDVDLVTGFATVRRAVVETKEEGLTFKEPKSRRGRRLISLPSIAVEMLREHVASQLEAKSALGSSYEETDLICSREDGSLWPPSAFTSTFRDLLKRRKIANIRFHDLRHSHVSQLLRSGVSPKVISERIGHSKVGFTLDVYSHLLPGMQEEAASKVDAGLRAALAKQRKRPVVQ